MEPRKTPFLDPARLLAAATESIAVARAEGVHAAVIGGLAMQGYGSPRLTGNVDLIADKLPASLSVERELTFGGWRALASDGVPVDWVIRTDEYAALYAEALDHARAGVAGLPTVQAEYLAAMKLAARRGKDHEDLVFLIQSVEDFDRDSARDIVNRLVGGRFARDELDLVFAESDWRTQRGE